jgi:hypothetical protein
MGFFVLPEVSRPGTPMPKYKSCIFGRQLDVKMSVVMIDRLKVLPIGLAALFNAVCFGCVAVSYSCSHDCLPNSFNLMDSFCRRH